MIKDELSIFRLLVFGTKLGPTLLELTVAVNTSRDIFAADSLVKVAQQAPSLTSVDFSAYRFLDEPITNLAMVCHELLYLRLHSFECSVLLSTTIGALFANCRQLQSVNLFGFVVDQPHTVKAILDNKVKLLSVAGLRLSDERKEEFRAHAMEMQLLPVPQ